jgi:hypothetical protein
MGQNPMATPNPRKQSLSGLGSWSYSRTQVETGDPLVSDSTSYNVFDYRLAARWMWNFESFEVGPEIAASRSNQINPESFELEATSTWQTGLIAEYNFVGNRAERSFVPSLVAGGLWQRSAGSSQWGLSSGLGIKIFALGANTAFRADVLYQAWLVDPLVHAGVLQLGVQSYF